MPRDMLRCAFPLNRANGATRISVAIDVKAKLCR